MKRATWFCFLILIGIFENNYSVRLPRCLCCLLFLRREKSKKNHALDKPLHDGEEMQAVGIVPVRSTVLVISRNTSANDLNLIVSAGHFSDDELERNEIERFDRSDTFRVKASIFETSRNATVFVPESETPPLPHAATQTPELDSLLMLQVPNNSLVHHDGDNVEVDFENIGSHKSSSVDSLLKEVVNSSETFRRYNSVSSDGSVVIVSGVNQSSQTNSRVTFKQ